MINTRSALLRATLLLGLSLIGAFCRANTATQQAMHTRDLAGSYSAGALYNLGNSYARQGQTALAVLNYERARVLAPNDPDIRANLQRERKLASLPAASNDFEARFRLLRPNTTYWLGLAGLVISGISALLLRLKKSPRLVSGAAFGAGLLMVAYTLNDAVATAHVMLEAVVMQSAAATAAPIANAETLFTVVPATLVHIEDTHGNFMLIRDAQGNVGWVSRSELTRVIDSDEEVHA